MGLRNIVPIILIFHLNICGLRLDLNYFCESQFQTFIFYLPLVQLFRSSSFFFSSDIFLHFHSLLLCHQVVLIPPAGALHAGVHPTILEAQYEASFLLIGHTLQTKGVKWVGLLHSQPVQTFCSQNWWVRSRRKLPSVSEFEGGQGIFKSAALVRCSCSAVVSIYH